MSVNGSQSIYVKSAAVFWLDYSNYAAALRYAYTLVWLSHTNVSVGLTTGDL